ncbi:MAG: tetratricopeptide repeat protein [Lewinellaceae bacterium]|nr:tetratricopeptide repeat protein [Lewinellaceae bacterium]
MGRFSTSGFGQVAGGCGADAGEFGKGKNQNDWKNAAIAASNLSELHLTLGSVQEAVHFGQQAVDFADRSGDGYHKESKRTTLADALHQSGKWEAAQQWFAEAEAMHRERRPEYRFLYSLLGFQYCDLLLGFGKWEEVLERAQEV